MGFWRRSRLAFFFLLGRWKRYLSAFTLHFLFLISALPGHSSPHVGPRVCSEARQLSWSLLLVWPLFQCPPQATVFCSLNFPTLSSTQLEGYKVSVWIMVQWFIEKWGERRDCHSHFGGSNVTPPPNTLASAPSEADPSQSQAAAPTTGLACVLCPLSSPHPLWPDTTPTLPQPELPIQSSGQHFSPQPPRLWPSKSPRTL